MALSVTPTDEMKTLTVGNKIYEIVDDQAREDVSEVKADLSELTTDLYKAFPTDTASGPVASFADGADNLPMRSVVAQIVPKQSGSGDPSPDNVRPISGWDAVNVLRMGKNLLSGTNVTQTINGITFTVNDDGVITANGTASANTEYVIEDFISNTTWRDLMPKTSYTLSGSPANSDTTKWKLRIYYNSDKIDTGSGVTIDYAGLPEYIITFKVSIVVYSGTTMNNVVFSPMLRFTSDTDSTYAKPSGIATHHVSLPQTVYGGQVDVVSGEGKVTYGMVDLGTLNWLYNGNWGGAGAFYCQTPPPGIQTVVSPGTPAKVICSKYPTVARNYLYDNPSAVGLCVPNNTAQVSIRNSAYNDETVFKASLSGVLLVYELAAPTDFTVISQEVPTFYGSNTVYADSGDVAVEYPADTKLYISRLTEPDSADMIADANIVSGKYFMVGNDLYLATANIANGGAIVPGTNCTKVSLATALNAINS